MTCENETFSRMKALAAEAPTIGSSAGCEDVVRKQHLWRCVGVVSAAKKMSAADIIRHSVPADHSCLFASVAYLCQGISGEVELRTAGRKLREVCAQAVLADPDPASRAIMLGHDSVEAYVQWIRNETHWGGEPEVLILAEHFETELVIVSCESLSVLRYAEGGKNGTGYLLEP